MLASKYHLKSKNSFDEVLNKGKFFQSESFGLAVLPSNLKDVSRFGFIISTKISKESVNRNRIKRAMSEAVRFKQSYIKKGFDVVFLAKQLSARKSTEEIMREVDGALIKSGLLEK